jgi:hypothetical protein
MRFKKPSSPAAVADAAVGDMSAISPFAAATCIDRSDTPRDSGVGLLHGDVLSSESTVNAEDKDDDPNDRFEHDTDEVETSRNGRV